MVRVVVNQVAARWNTWRHLPRSPLSAFLWTLVGVAAAVVVLGVALILLVLTLPVALVVAVVWWARARLTAMRGDGRRNVRVVGAAPASGR